MRWIIIALLALQFAFALGSNGHSNQCIVTVEGSVPYNKIIDSNFYSYDEYKMYKDSKGDYKFKEFSTQAQSFIEKVKIAAQKECAKSNGNQINIRNIQHQVDKDRFYFSASIQITK